MQRRRGHGYSLLELLIVIGLLGLIAAVAAPALQTEDKNLLERDTARIVSAIRFARSEAIRSGQPYGVIANETDQSVKLFRLDELTNPATVLYDVYDPMTKGPYELYFDADNGPALTDVYFRFESDGTTYADVVFSGGTGIPIHDDSGTTRVLKTGYIEISHGDSLKTVFVSPMTARVTVQ